MALGDKLPPSPLASFKLLLLARYAIKCRPLAGRSFTPVRRGSESDRGSQISRKHFRDACEVADW